MRTSFRPRTIAAALAGLALAATACSDDDDTSSAATTAAEQATTTSGAETSDDLAAYCDSMFAIEGEFGTEEPDPAVIETLVDDLESVHPEEIDGQITVMVSSARAVLEGDFSAFESPEFAAAESDVGAFNFENCGAETGEVQTVDYAFEGIPAEVPAGKSIVLIANGGGEVHELTMYRKNDGVTQPMTDILALGEEEGLTLVTPVAHRLVGEPGEVSYLYADLDPGDYAAVCFLPVGATDLATLETLGDDAPPHFTQGMVTEFAVTG